MTTRRVVVVDSGVDPNHPALRGRARVEPGPAFGPDGPLADEHGATDQLGHGTAVAATIAAFTDAVELVTLRVFDRDATCDFRAVLHALRHAVRLRPALVNLSLGTTSLRYRQELVDIVAEARQVSTRIVAPASYGGLPCDPGNLAGVESVVADPNVLPMVPELRPHAGRLVWFASPLPPRDQDGLRLLRARGDSLACAAVTGALLRSAPA